MKSTSSINFPKFPEISKEVKDFEEARSLLQELRVSLEQLQLMMRAKFDNYFKDLENLMGDVEHTFGTAAPTFGTYGVGDKCWNTTPVAGGTVGWVCTTAGTPGTWKAFGDIAA